MTRSRRTLGSHDLLERVRTADPWSDDALDVLAPHAECTALLERIATGQLRSTASASKQYPAAGRDHGRFPSHRTRITWATAVGVGAAASLVAVSLVGIGGPGNPTGPSVASASELLEQTADVARTAPDFTLTGSQRVYGGRLLHGGEDVASGEYWVSRDGSALLRTRTYSASAARVLAVPVGESEFTRTRRPAVDSGETKEWTYRGIRKLPTDPAALGAWIRSEVARTPLDSSTGFVPPLAADPNARALALAMDLVTQRLAPPALRAAGLEVIAELPGSVRLGTGTDALGRTGELIGIPNPLDATAQDTLLVVPRSGQVLEYSRAAATVDWSTEAGPDSYVPQGSHTFAKSMETYVGPVVVSAERVVPEGISLTPR